MKYSIIQCITNNYDEIFDCGDTEAAERLLFTDKNISVKNWKVNLIKTHKDFPFDDIFKIRWNPFDYTDSDYVVWIDGSIKIIGSIKKYIEDIIKSGAEFATLKHPFRDNIFEEYREWCRIRNYDKLKAFEWMNYMQDNGWNPKNNGLYQVNICIFKNTQKIREFCKDVNKELHALDSNHYERLDQTVVSYLLKTKYKDMKVFELNENMYLTDKELQWNRHKGNIC